MELECACAACATPGRLHGKTIEPLIVFDRVLCQDPAGAYAQMDFDSRKVYRDAVEEIAVRSE